ncbi:MAG: c-type cytochrome [Sulfurimonas sp.]
MKYLLYLTLPCLLVADSSFITIMEYSSQLYKNPRGIGCQNCHGEKGEGKLVANYTHNNVNKKFAGSAINKLEWSTFYYALNRSNNGMPRYYLTEKEIQALYLYINEDELRKAEKEALKTKNETQRKEAPQAAVEEPKIQKIEPKVQKAEPKKEEPKVQKVEPKAEPKKEKPKMKMEDPRYQTFQKIEPKNEAPKMLRYEDYPDR